LGFDGPSIRAAFLRIAVWKRLEGRIGVSSGVGAAPDGSVHDATGLGGLYAVSSEVGCDGGGE
jgi:hypothetical protein